MKECKHGVDDGACKKCYHQATNMQDSQSAGQEAIYQARVYGGWCDVTKDEFDQIQSEERPKRIVYAAPVNGGMPQALTVIQRQALELAIKYMKQNAWHEDSEHVQGLRALLDAPVNGGEREALKEIASWPDGGNRYGQDNIKRFARDALDKGERAADAQQVGWKDKRDAEYWRALVDNQWTIMKCACVDPKTGEDYFEWAIVEGSGEWFRSPAQAIDAAIAANQAKGDV